RATASAAIAQESTVSGLYLIQFRWSLSEAQRGELGTAGVELLHFVPDDAFVAKLQSARLNALRALPFVQWVGEYRPEHKLHRTLQPGAAAAAAAEPIGVAVLLVPRAS